MNLKLQLTQREHSRELVASLLLADAYYSAVLDHERGPEMDYALVDGCLHYLIKRVALTIEHPTAKGMAHWMNTRADASDEAARETAAYLLAGAKAVQDAVGQKWPEPCKALFELAHLYHERMQHQGKFSVGIEAYLAIPVES